MFIDWFVHSSFQPTRCTSDFVRKQLQNTIHGRQKPNGGKDLSGLAGHNSMSANLDPSIYRFILSLFVNADYASILDQKGAYFRSQLSSQMSTPPLQTSMRPQQQPSSQGKISWLMSFIVYLYCDYTFISFLFIRLFVYFFSCSSFLRFIIE